MTTADHENSAKSQRSTALVRLTAPQSMSAYPHCRVRHNPSFVAQLIATAADLPHTRLRRRATPTDALAAYSSVETLMPVRTGHTRRIA